MERSTVVEDISQQVTCSICLDHYKTPKTVIPCLHNFCEVCLEDMIASTAQPKISRPSDPRIFAIFTFPCPSCRGLVEFPVRIPRPWNMKQIAQEAVKKEFKTNFQIENQLEIINKKIEKGCPQHQGEVRMWYCKVCLAIICQFCVQEDHKPPDHEITLLNVVAQEKRQALSSHREVAARKMCGLEVTCADIQNKLETIHSARSKCGNQEKLFTDEFSSVHKELDSLEEGLLARGRNFDEQLSSKEMEILEVYQGVSEDVDRCKTQINDLDKILSDTDLELVENSSDMMLEAFVSPGATSVPNLEIEEPPDTSLDLLQQRMIDIKRILKNMARDFELNRVTTLDSDRDIDTSESAPLDAGRITYQCVTHGDLEPIAEDDETEDISVTAEVIASDGSSDVVEATTHAESKDAVNSSSKANNQKKKVRLKYTYEKDQWSPLNPEGKRKYGRDFLLQIRPECTVKPVGLPNIPDIILDKADIRPISLVPEPRLKKGTSRRNTGGIDFDFMPEYMRSPGDNLQQYASLQLHQPVGEKSKKMKKKRQVKEKEREDMEPLTRYMLARANHAEQRLMFGKRLYPLIHQMNKDLPGKITGVLLEELNNDELLRLLESCDFLTTKVEDTVEMLNRCQHFFDST